MSDTTLMIPLIFQATRQPGGGYRVTHPDGTVSYHPSGTAFLKWAMTVLQLAADPQLARVQVYQEVPSDGGTNH